jgi:tRNA modification GTPase
LWVDAADARGVLSPEIPVELLLRVWNKSDLVPASKPVDGGVVGRISVSCRNGSGIEELGRAIVERLRDRVSCTEPPLITRQRHRDCLESMARHLDRALAGPYSELELVTEEIRLAANEIGRLSGHIEVENLLDVIFRDFCIGK